MGNKLSEPDRPGFLPRGDEYQDIEEVYNGEAEKDEAAENLRAATATGRMQSLELPK